MEIKLNENLVTEKYSFYIGQELENEVTELVFNISKVYDGYNRRLDFMIDNNDTFYDLLNHDTYVVKNNLTRYKKLKCQLVLTKDNLVKKSNVFQLLINPSINSEKEIIEEDPQYLVLSDLIEHFENSKSIIEYAKNQGDYAKKEADKVTNEISKFKNLTEEYNTNAETKLEEYDINAQTKTQQFNSTVITKNNEYNANAETKVEEYDINAQTKTQQFNSNVITKNNEYNANAETKVEEYDINAQIKTKEFNKNVDQQNKYVDEIISDRIIGFAEGKETEVYVSNSNLKSETQMININFFGESSYIKKEASKNLFNYLKGDLEKYFDANGILNSNINGYSSIIEVTPNINYFLKYTNTTNENFRSYIFVFDENMNRLDTINWGDINTPNQNINLKKNMPQNSKYLTISFLDIENITLDKIKQLNIMLSTEDVEYVPHYNASPSPEIPTEIISVGSSWNLFDKDNINLLNNVALTSNGLVNSNEAKCFYINIEKYTTYTVTKEILGTNNRLVAAIYEELPTLQNIPIIYQENNYEKNLIISNSTGKYLLIYLYFKSTLPSFEEIVKGVQIVKGTDLKAYKSCNEKSIEIITKRKNLFNIDYNIGEQIIKSGITLTILSKDSFILNGTAEITLGFTNLVSMNVKKGEKYSLSEFDSKNILVGKIKTPAGEFYYNQLYSNNSLTTIHHDGILYIEIYIPKDTNFDNQIFNCQLQKNNVIDIYEPYEEITTKILLPQTLKSIGNKYDLLNREGNIIKNFETINYTQFTDPIVLDAYSGESTYYIDLGGINKAKFYSAIYCNIFEPKSIWGNDVEGISFEGTSSQQSFRLRIKKHRLKGTTKQNIIEFLTENKLEIQYELPIPEIFELVESEKEKLCNLKLLNGYNNITCESNISFEYCMQKQNYIDSKFKELEERINNNEQTLVEQIAMNLESEIQNYE